MSPAPKAAFVAAAQVALCLSPERTAPSRGPFSTLYTGGRGGGPLVCMCTNGLGGLSRKRDCGLMFLYPQTCCSFLFLNALRAQWPKQCQGSSLKIFAASKPERPNAGFLPRGSVPVTRRAVRRVLEPCVLICLETACFACLPLAGRVGPSRASNAAQAPTRPLAAKARNSNDASVKNILGILNDELRNELRTSYGRVSQRVSLPRFVYILCTICYES